MGGEGDAGGATAPAVDAAAPAVEEGGSGGVVPEAGAQAQPDDGGEGAAESAPAVGEQTPVADKPLSSLVESLFGDGEKPAFYEAHREYLRAKGQKKYDLDLAKVDEWPMEAQRLLYNLVEESQENTEALKQQLAKRDDAGKDWAAEKRRLASERAKLLGFGANEQIRKVIAGLEPKGRQPDPYSEEGVAWLVNKQTAAILKQFVDAWQSQAEQLQQQVAQEEATVREQAEVEATASYIRQHQDDFDNPVVFERIKGLIEKSKGAISVQDAHEFVIGRFAIEQDEQARAQARERARKHIRPGSGKVAGPPPKPKNLDTAGELRFYQEFPDALQREYDEAVRRGTSY